MDDGYDSLYEKDTEYKELFASAYQTALERQIGGSHYKKYKIQPAEYMHANDIPFLEGEAISYITRWRDKNGIPDVRKAIHILEILIQLEEAKNKNAKEPMPAAEYSKAILGGAQYLNFPGAPGNKQCCGK